MEGHFLLAGRTGLTATTKFKEVKVKLILGEYSEFRHWLNKGYEHIVGSDLK